MAISTQSGSSQGTSSGFSSSSPVQNPGAAGYYQQLLGLNQQNYKSVLDAYSGGLKNAQTQLPGIYQGYGGVENQVMGTLGLNGKGWGVATPAAQAIQRTFEQQSGNTQQQLINSGLSGTTVLANLQRGNALSAGQAYGALGAQLAQTAAGYQSQLGLAQLGARQQGLGMQTGLAGQLGGSLAGYRFANTFGNLYGQQSQSQNASQNSSYNLGSSYSPSGGGGGYGGSSGAPNEGTQNFGYNAGQLFPGQYLGGYGSSYYGTNPGYGGYTPGGSTLNLGGYPEYDEAGTGVVPGDT